MINLDKSIFDEMKYLSENSQDILMSLITKGIINSDDTIHTMLEKVDSISDDYLINIIDSVMKEISTRENQFKPAQVVTNNDNALHGKRGDLGHFGFYVGQDTNPMPENLGITLQELINIADNDDKIELDYIISRHFMKPSSDVNELMVKLNTILNPQIGNMEAQIDITASQTNIDDIFNTAVGNLTPEQQHEYNKAVRCTHGINLINKLLAKLKNPNEHKFILFLNQLDDNNELLDIIESGFKLIHNCN